MSTPEDFLLSEPGQTQAELSIWTYPSGIYYDISDGSEGISLEEDEAKKLYQILKERFDA